MPYFLVSIPNRLLPVDSSSYVKHSCGVISACSVKIVIVTPLFTVMLGVVHIRTGIVGIEATLLAVTVKVLLSVHVTSPLTAVALSGFHAFRHPLTVRV